MPDEKPAEVTAPAALDPRAALQALRDLFAVIEPRDQVTLEAASGRTYEVRTILAARRQIRTLRVLEEAMEAAWSIQAEPAGTEATQGARFLAILKAALGHEEILDKVAEAFGEAFAEVVAEEAKAAGVPLTATVSADLFPAESIVEALLPLLSRLVAKALATMEKARKGIPTKTQPEA